MNRVKSPGATGTKKGAAGAPVVAGRRRSALDKIPLLSDFEKAYLEKLRNHERPKVVVKFLHDDEVPADTDFVFEAVTSPSPRREEDEFAFMSSFSARRGSVTYIDHAEADRLEREVDNHKYKSYYKNISKSMKAFDATFAKVSDPAKGNE